MNDGGIFALASAPGRAGVAVLRASGRRLAQVIETLTRKPAPAPRMAALRRLYDSEGAVIDQALVIYFPAPHSFTGEDVVEFHIHGGRAVLAALTDALLARGLRPAEAGEFSRRAFHNGKMDLTEAEAIADLVDAQTEAQRKQALRQLDGALGRFYEEWRHRLLMLQAYLEAYIDFPDEGLPDDLFHRTSRDVGDLRTAIALHLADGHRGERLREGLALVILGPPNVGKSSLMNKLAQRDVAIVSAQAGTTRDVIELPMDLGGYPVTLYDTAGLRETSDEIESEGVRRAQLRAEAADLKLYMLDAAKDWRVDLSRLDPDRDSFLILNKCEETDLTPGPIAMDLSILGAYALSVQTGAGLGDFLNALGRAVADRLDVSEAPVLTRARHRAALIECEAALARFEAGLDQARMNGMVELLAEDVRLAARALGRITGRVDVEDMLDLLFSAFCIGK